MSASRKPVRRSAISYSSRNRVRNGRFWKVRLGRSIDRGGAFQKPPPNPFEFWKVFDSLNGMIIGYARVSTDDQTLDSQTDALQAAGAGRIFADKISGSLRARPQLDRLLDQLRPGDVVTVTKYDRLARSLKDLLDIVDRVEKRGAGFRSLAEDIDTTTPAGRLVFHVFASIAQFERERIAERTKEGLQAARSRGRIGGRPPALTAAQKAETRRMRDEEGRSIAEIARLFKVSQQTVRRA